MNVYTENGYKDRRDYLKQMASEHEVPFGTVRVLADMLGPDEDFDGLVVALEDYS